MLTHEQNALVTQTGPGTPGGDLFRRYWLPVALSEELGHDGTPVPVEILSEELVLFRTEDGKPALIGLHCPHRGADLSFGRCEDGGLRCVYHGWLIGPDGACLQQPGEPRNSTFREKVRHPGYPCREVGGLILAYLGPGAPPEFPRLPFARVPTDHVYATKVLHECNYLQGNEGNVDPQHVSFLHRFNITAATRPRLEATEIIAKDVAPELLIEETPYGFRTYTQRVANEREHYVRVTNFIMPSCSAFVGTARVDPAVKPADENDGCQMHWHVPIDDHHHWKYVIVVRWDGPIDRPYVHGQCAAELNEFYELEGNRRNRYRQNRREMARGETYIGMGRNFQLHDKFATESQRPISDRTREHLGVTDRAVITMRRQLLEAIDHVRAGKEPLLVSRDPTLDPLEDLVVKAAFIPAGADPSGFWRTPATADA